MNPNTFPTKGNLILAKNSLILARQGYELMDKKRSRTSQAEREGLSYFLFFYHNIIQSFFCILPVYFKVASSFTYALAFF